MSNFEFPDHIAPVSGDGTFGAGVFSEGSQKFIATVDVPEGLDRHDENGSILQEMIYRYNEHEDLVSAANLLERILEHDESHGHIPPTMRREAERILKDE